MITSIIFLIAGIAIGAVSGILYYRANATKTTASLNAEITVLQRELELTRERQRKDDEERDRRYAEQIRLAQEQAKSATEQLLKSRTEELNRSNAQQMSAIIDPLKEKIKEMQAAMDSSREQYTRNSATLHQAIEDIMKRTASIGDEAGKLAKALRHENKTQGNWGEAILSELLESQGLHEGVHYDVQSTIKDKNGRPVLNETTDKRMIPDVILKYSNDKALIIDAKVSLSAYIDYTSAETDEQRAEALDRHVKSIKSHVKELAGKNYKKYILPPRESLDYMLMFVPNESALQLALVNAPSLWRDALSQGVFIVGEYNLIAALRIIRLAWIQEVQAEQQRKVFEEATMMIERVGEFYKRFQSIRKCIDDLSGAYSEAEKKLMTGRQSIIVPAQRLKKMGYKEKDSSPLPDAAELFIDE
jgi:DNA recombination protein RmuC